MSALLPQLEDQLLAAARREHGARRTRPGLMLGRGRLRTAALVAVVTVLALAGVALAARYLVGIGAPVHGSANPGSQPGVGAIIRSSVRILIRVPDPVGGPPWGIRFYAQRGGQGCVDIGRVLDGRLGALGRDGFDHDDGLLHEQPVGTIGLGGSCSELDGAGHLYGVGGGESPGLASGGPSRCRLSAADHTLATRSLPLCPAEDLRNITYGFLGPDARTVVMRFAGRLFTIHPVGPQGAVLVVTRANRPHPIGSGAPPPSLAMRVTFDNGLTCSLGEPPPGTPASALRCPNRLPGYVPFTHRLPPSGAVRAPLKLSVTDPGPRESIVVRFASPVPATIFADAYTVWMYGPRRVGCVAVGFAQTSTAIPAGRPLAMYLLRSGNTPNPRTHWCPGHYTGTVTFRSPNRVVGRFALDIP